MAVRRAHAGVATPEDRNLLGRTATRRLAGGRNNAVHAAELDGRRVCLKLHRTDDRDRAGREWRALGVLARRAPELAPLPYLLDQAAPPPLVAMELLPGRPLGGRLDARQLAALAEVHAALHRITPPVTQVPLEPVVGRPPALLARAGAMLDPAGATRPDAGLLRRQAGRLWRRWSTGPDPDRRTTTGQP
jgi:Ser/Thr protein kinase RdoA (MazF antagonist)